MRRAARRDTAEAAIVDQLELRGAFVVRLSAKDIPDLLVGWRGDWFLAEVKSAAWRQLSEGQKRFRDICKYRRLPWVRLNSPQDADLVLDGLWRSFRDNED